MPAPVAVHPEVTEALREHRPVVALESAVITSGLPRQSLAREPDCDAPGWDPASPINLEVARLLERTVRNGGVVPATVGVIDGTLHIGLSDGQLERLAKDRGAMKSAVTDLAHRLASGATAGTTVSATLAACALPSAGPIQVFATGGIGGVHRDWVESPDISADLSQIATSPVCVVSAGAKSVLDVPATVETLEALGVLVIGYRTDWFPLFYSLGDDDIAVPTRLDDAPDIANACRVQWETLGRSGGVLVANPVPEDHALNAADIEQIVSLAEALATARRVSGRDRTPFLLAEIAERTGGASLQANIALLLSNAALAADIAVTLINAAKPTPDS